MDIMQTLEEARKNQDTLIGAIFRLENSERNRQIIMQILSGSTFAQTARDFRISRDRTRQIFARAFRRMQEDGSDSSHVTSLGLKPRTRNCLKYEGVETVDQLRIWLCDEKWKHCQNFGIASLRDVEDALIRRDQKILQED